MKQFRHTANIVHGTPWMIERRALATVAAIFQRHLDGEAAPMVSEGQGEGIISRVGDWSVVRVHGTILPRANMMTNMSGGVGCSDIQSALELAVNSDSAGIVMDFDSPGGSVMGIFEAADAINLARISKPVLASVSGLCCSAAYLLASQCDEISATRASVIGSIGVISTIQDDSRSDKNAGVDSITVASSKRKAMSGMSEDEIRDEMKTEVARYFGMMKETINARRPGLVVDAESFPGTMLATEAVESGLIDEIGTLAEIVQQKVS